MAVVRCRQNTLFCQPTTLPLMFLFVVLSDQTNTVVTTKWCAIHLCSTFLSSFIVILGCVSGLRLILSIWFWVLQTVALIFKYTPGGVGCVTVWQKKRCSQGGTYILINACTLWKKSHFKYSLFLRILIPHVRNDTQQPSVYVDSMPTHMAYLFEMSTSVSVSVCCNFLLNWCMRDENHHPIILQREKQRWSEKLGDWQIGKEGDMEIDTWRSRTWF